MIIIPPDFLFVAKISTHQKAGDGAVVPIGGEQQGRLSWTELQPQIELQQMND